jgi:hypothetical protein
MVADKSQVAGRRTVSMHASAWPINVHKGKKKLKHLPGILPNSLMFSIY